VGVCEVAKDRCHGSCSCVWGALEHCRACHAFL